MTVKIFVEYYYDNKYNTLYLCTILHQSKDVLLVKINNIHLNAKHSITQSDPLIIILFPVLLS